MPQALSGTAPPSSREKTRLLMACLIFVKGEEDQSTVVVEVGIAKQWDKPVIDPLARKVDGGIMATVDHIGRHENPLREGRRIDIGGKVVEVAMKRKAGGDRSDRIVEDGRVVLTYVEGMWARIGGEVVSRRESILFGMSKTDKQTSA